MCRNPKTRRAGQVSSRNRSSAPDRLCNPPLPSSSGVLMSNSGQYNRSVLISAIRVARARSRLWGYRPNRTSEPGNFKPAILRNFKPALTPKDKPEDASRRLPA